MKSPTFFTVVTILVPSLVNAQWHPPLRELEDGYLTFHLDNDLFGGNDQDYTNGARLSWISGNRRIDQLSPAQRWLRRLSGDPDSYGVFRRASGFEDPEKIAYNYGFSLTQLMFTPEDPLPYQQPLWQRRYAGWLGLGFSLHVKDDRILNSVEFTMGTTGPNSMAEKTQDFIHDLQGVQRFNGWDDQIPNEITADLSFVQKRRLDLARFGYGVVRLDGLGEWGTRLGSFRTNAHVGGFFRLGVNLPPDFSDPRLSGTAYSHRYISSADEYMGHWSLFLLFGSTVRAIGHDASIDGPLFSDFETGIERRALVGEVFGGFGIRYKDVEFSYAHTWRTEEYRTQRGISNFGSLAVRLNF